MRKKEFKLLYRGIGMLMLFGIWTWMLQIVDVRPAGATGTEIGMAAWNVWFHQLTGVHLWLYTITDWLGLIPIAVCLSFGVVGSVQLLKRRRLRNVDVDILLLGIYYVLVILGYLIFEMVPLNYRPILIEGRIEASYPSSTTLLVLSVMPTLVFQLKRRVKHAGTQKIFTRLAMLFSAAMVLGRLISGVHWFTDIVGAVCLSTGLFVLYQAAVLLCEKKKS